MSTVSLPRSAPRRVRAAPAKAPLPLGTLAANGALAVLGASATWAAGRSPFTTTAAWAGPAEWRLAASLALGLALGAISHGITRVVLARYAWARTLADDLVPSIRSAPTRTLCALAFASGVSEELFFRGLLVPLVGASAAALAFGLIHRARGDVQLPYTVWATLMGLAFGAVFVATGHLAGAIVAHALSNLLNLKLLRDRLSPEGDARQGPEAAANRSPSARVRPSSSASVRSAASVPSSIPASSASRSTCSRLVRSSRSRSASS